MGERVSVRELRNRGGDVLARVEEGRHVVVSRDGVDVAELRPVIRNAAATSELIRRRSRLPIVDPAALRADLDAIIDGRL